MNIQTKLTGLRSKCFGSRIAQSTVIGVYLLSSSLWLHTAERSVLAFLMVLFSFLLLYYADKLPVPVRIAVGGGVFCLLIPLVTDANPYYLEVVSNVGIFIALALGLNIVVGFAGLLDLGFVAFFAIGAYTYAIFATKQANQFIPPAFMQFPLSGEWFWLFLVIGLFVAALFGVILGFPALKVKGDYLAIVTLGFGEIVRIVFNNLDRPVNITNGSRGLPNIAQPELFGIAFKPIHYYYLILIVVAITIIVIRRMENSRLGRSWVAIREDELAAQASGIRLLRTKLFAFAIGASFAGVMGVIFAAKQTFIDPSSFVLMQSISIVVMVVLGGSGSIPGVIVGAAIVTVLNVQVLQEFATWLKGLSFISIPPELDPSQYQRLILGIILVLFAIFRPKGIIPARRPSIDMEAIRRSDKEGKPLE